jgi:hypothetical protein
MPPAPTVSTFAAATITLSMVFISRILVRVRYAPDPRHVRDIETLQRRPYMRPLHVGLSEALSLANEGFRTAKVNKTLPGKRHLGFAV